MFIVFCCIQIEVAMLECKTVWNCFMYWISVKSQADRSVVLNDMLNILNENRLSRFVGAG